MNAPSQRKDLTGAFFWPARRLIHDLTTPGTPLPWIITTLLWLWLITLVLLVIDGVLGNLA